MLTDWKYAAEITSNQLLRALNAFEPGRRNGDLVNLCLLIAAEHEGLWGEEDARQAMEDAALQWCEEHTLKADKPGRDYIEGDEGEYTIAYCASHYRNFDKELARYYLLDLEYVIPQIR